ncbi:Aminoacyl-histidine dipeptidase (Peptidase D) [hydrothermal vent metagenome]|uniref:Aminoacyl-histidine dipeptidase (Peptidase D) n=1 Tax=hydrothermal vent metagenome TaxID=652676 RepID=A0A1W1CBX0_9ZZZZ
MSSIIKYFKEIASIPHCSRDAERLKEFLVQFAKDRGYEVAVDEAQNILISKGSPNLCLQAHYDMVCMGEAPNLDIYIEDGLMRARDSSLGADNGIAIAMMMELMDSGSELEFLITADEEIGLIGASALSFDLHSTMMLNLDSEDEAEVYIGCAGGVDIVASKPYATTFDDRESYEISIDGLAGGHSGVDIDRNIPNAIKLLASYIKERELEIVSIEGGERLNSIPSSAKAIVKSTTPPKGNDIVKVCRVDSIDPILYGGSEVIDLLKGFSHGVQAMNEMFKIPEISINLAIVSTENGIVTIETSARAMSPDGLAQISNKTVEFFKSFGYSVELRDKYPSWRPEINSFTKDVERAMIEVFGESKMVAIHAGLECGVISQKYPSILLASIGPTIRYPHSTREEVDLESVEKTFEVLKLIITNLKN